MTDDCNNCPDNTCDNNLKTYGRLYDIGGRPPHLHFTVFDHSNVDPEMRVAEANIQGNDVALFGGHLYEIFSITIKPADAEPTSDTMARVAGQVSRIGYRSMGPWHHDQELPCSINISCGEYADCDQSTIAISIQRRASQGIFVDALRRRRCRLREGNTRGDRELMISFAFNLLLLACGVACTFILGFLVGTDRRHTPPGERWTPESAASRLRMLATSPSINELSVGDALELVASELEYTSHVDPYVRVTLVRTIYMVKPGNQDRSRFKEFDDWDLALAYAVEIAKETAHVSTIVRFDDGVRIQLWAIGGGYGFENFKGTKRVDREEPEPFAVARQP